MREGLRSRTRLGGEVSSEGVVHKRRVRVKNEGLVSGGEGLVAPTSSVEKNGKVECDAKEECVLDLNASASGNVDLAENGNNESCFRDEDGKIEAEVDKKVSEGSVGKAERVLDLNVSTSENVGLAENENNGSCLRDEDGNVEVEADKKGTEGLIRKANCDLDLKLSVSGNVGLAENGNNGRCLRDEDSNVEVEADKKKTKGLTGKAECDLDLNLSVSRNVDLTENVNNESCVRDGNSNTEVEADAKGTEGLIERRVLRSRSKRGDDKISYNGGNDGVFSGSNGENGGFERRIKVKTEYEEVDEDLTDGNKNEKVKVKVGGQGKKLKRKRGRPPKTELKEKDQLVDKPQRKLGRPPKTELKENNQLLDQPLRKRGRRPKAEIKEKDWLVDQSPRKRGRRPKTDQQKHLMTVGHNSKGKASLQEGKEVLTIRDGSRTNAVDNTCSRRSSGKDLKEKGSSPLRKSKLRKVLKTEVDGMASPLRSNTLSTHAAKKGGMIEKKKLVRDQIMERLSAAGWTVDRRPRNGRNYIDAVYVGLDKSTHWSITLAYKRLKEHYEAGDGEGKMYKPGFEFIPIPEEDFNLLTRVVTKKRVSKKVKCVSFGGKGGKRVDGVNGKKKKRKPGSGAGMGKPVKGKMKRKRSLPGEGNTNVTLPNRLPVLARDHKRHKTHKKTRCALLVRDAMEEVDSEINGYVPYSGKRTVLAWMIDLGTIPQNGKVHYMQDRSESPLLEGKITGDGILCGCCNKITTISDFEAHAGSKQSDPLKNIYTDEETSLLQCLLDSWNKQDESERNSFHFVDVAGEDPNDDTCGVCGDGGDLICCDSCPSTFHKSCLDTKKFPSGDWHCIYCCCKFCGLVGGSSNQSVANDDFTMPALLTCHLCEEKFHISCIEANGGKTDDIREALFCGNKCQELSERLEMLLGVKHDIEDGFSWSFIRRSDAGFDASQTKPQMIECNSKLAVALSIMNECFMPFIDHRSGTNLFRSILYSCGSNFKRLNYSGFITATLERGDEIICVASIRIHGSQLAEMPFIGTRYMYRRQGMCRRLLNAIERALSSLHVELLVIPAISELRETWTSVFGFEPLDQISKQITKSMNLLVFPHVDLLQKKISRLKIANESLLLTGVSDHKKTHLDESDSSGSDCCKKNEKAISIESDCGHFVNSLNNAPGITSNTIQNSKSPTDVTCQAVCQTVHENLVVDNKSTVNAPDYVDNSCCQEDKERRCLSTPCINTGGSEGNYVGALLEVTENCSNEVKLTIEVVSNNKSAEKFAPSGAENIPTDSQIVFRTRESEKSAESNHNSHNVSDSCELRFKTDFTQPSYTEYVDDCSLHSRPDGDSASVEAGLTTNVLMPLESQNITKDLPVNCENSSSVVNASNAAEAKLCYSKTTDLQTHKNPRDCQSILVSSGICEIIADGVNERNKASKAADADFLPADFEVIPSDKLGSHSRPNCDSASCEAGLTTNDLMPALESQNITKDLPVNCENNSSGVSTHNADELELCYSNTTALQTNTNAGECQSIVVSSGVCEKIVDGANERNIASSEADADFLPVDIEVIPDSQPSSHSRQDGDSASGEAGLTTNVLTHLESQNISPELPVNCENNSSVVSAPNGDEVELCYSKTTDLQTNQNPGDCQSIVSSGVCEKISDGVNKRNIASSTVETDVLPADTEVVSNNEPGIKEPPELAEPDLQVDRTAQSNSPSSQAPNTASGVALHSTSASST